MKKYVAVLTVVVFLSLLFACGGGKYADAKKVMEKFVGATNDFVNGLEKADDAPATAAVINAYADKMKGITAEMKRVQEKYPEIKDQKEPPAELKEVVAQVEEVMPKMMGAMMKVAKYAQDEEVMAAQKKLQEAMADLN